MQNKKRSRIQMGRENQHNNSMQFLFNNNNQNRNSSHKYSDDEDFTEIRQAPKRLALQDSNISRYEKEFVELSLIGM